MRNSLHGSGSLTSSNVHTSTINSNLNSALSMPGLTANRRDLLNKAKNFVAAGNYKDAAYQVWYILGSPANLRPQAIAQNLQAQAAQVSAAQTAYVAPASVQVAQPVTTIDPQKQTGHAYKYEMSHSDQNRYIRENASLAHNKKPMLTEYQYRQKIGMSTEVVSGRYISPSITSNNSKSSSGTGSAVVRNSAGEAVRQTSTLDTKASVSSGNAKLAAQSSGVSNIVKIISAEDTQKAKDASVAKKADDARKAKDAADKAAAAKKQADAELKDKQAETARKIAEAKKTADAKAKADALKAAAKAKSDEEAAKKKAKAASDAEKATKAASDAHAKVVELTKKAVSTGSASVSKAAAKAVSVAKAANVTAVKAVEKAKAVGVTNKYERSASEEATKQSIMRGMRDVPKVTTVTRKAGKSISTETTEKTPYAGAYGFKSNVLDLTGGEVTLIANQKKESDYKAFKTTTQIQQETRVNKTVQKAVSEAKKIRPNASKEYLEGVANVARKSQMSPGSVLKEDLNRANQNVAKAINLPTLKKVAQVRDNFLSGFEVTVTQKDDKLTGQKASKRAYTLKDVQRKQAKKVDNSAVLSGIRKFGEDEYNSLRSKPVSYAGQTGIEFAAGAALGAGTTGGKYIAKKALVKTAVKLPKLAKIATVTARHTDTLIDAGLGITMGAGLVANEVKYRKSDKATRGSEAEHVADYLKMGKSLAIGGIGYSKGAKSLKLGEVKIPTIRKEIKINGNIRSATNGRPIPRKTTGSAKQVSRSSPTDSTGKVTRKAIPSNPAKNTIKLEQQLKMIDVELSADKVTVLKQRGVSGKKANASEKSVSSVLQTENVNGKNIKTVRNATEMTNERQHNPVSKKTQKLSRQQIKRGTTKAEEAEIKATERSEKLKRVSPDVVTSNTRVVQYNGQEYTVSTKLTGRALTRFLKKAEDARNEASYSLGENFKAQSNVNKEYRKILDTPQGRLNAAAQRIKKATDNKIGMDKQVPAPDYKLIEVDGGIYNVPASLKGNKLSAYIKRLKANATDRAIDIIADKSGIVERGKYAERGRASQRKGRRDAKPRTPGARQDNYRNIDKWDGIDIPNGFKTKRVSKYESREVSKSSGKSRKSTGVKGKGAIERIRGRIKLESEKFKKILDDATKETESTRTNRLKSRNVNPNKLKQIRSSIGRDVLGQSRKIIRTPASGSKTTSVRKPSLTNGVRVKDKVKDKSSEKVSNPTAVKQKEKNVDLVKVKQTATQIQSIAVAQADIQAQTPIQKQTQVQTQIQTPAVKQKVTAGTATPYPSTPRIRDDYTVSERTGIEPPRIRVKPTPIKGKTKRRIAEEQIIILKKKQKLTTEKNKQSKKNTRKIQRDLNNSLGGLKSFL